MKRKLKKKNLIIITIVFISLIVGIAFGVKALINSDKDSKKDDIVEEQKEPEVPKVSIVDVNSKSRPFAVMINNMGATRPYHTGLQDAYLVYEIVVEGGITRYLALFKDKTPEVVGSVRSARHYYIDYVLENDAYYVHWGWSPQAQTDIKKLAINNFNGLFYSKPYFFRQKLPVSSDHRGFANLKEIADLAKKRGLRSETKQALLLNYSATPIDISSKDDVKEATKIDLKYSNSFITNYVYDSEAKVYKQLVNNKEHVDYETKQQYTVKNIIVYKVKNNNISGDNKGRQDLDNLGTGEGYFITEGMVVPITWKKDKRDSQTVYYYKDGTEITVNDGNTWIHIVPTSGNIGIS